MKSIDIIEGTQQGIDTILFKNWRHSGCIDFINSDAIYFTVDNKHYILRLEEESNKGYELRHMTAEELIEHIDTNDSVCNPMVM